MGWGLSRRTSAWQKLWSVASDGLTGGQARQAGKVVLTAAGGAMAVTAASAAVSAIRHGERS
jgi:hypothetical protein